MRYPNASATVQLVAERLTSKHRALREPNVTADGLANPPAPLKRMRVGSVS